MTDVLPEVGSDDPVGGEGVPEREANGQGALPQVPWREIIRYALLGVLGVLCLVGIDVARYGGSNPVSLVQPGTDGPSIAIIREDFPEVQPPSGLGLDGQQFYAIARNPLHPEQVAPHVDRPRYRLQRPLLPWTGWLMHPSGGGVGLIWALLAAGTLFVFAGAVASGVLATTFGGKPWLAAVLPLLPGTYWSLRVTVADAPALSLALVALALSVRRKPVAAIAVGVLAVLAKEPTILIFVGWALWRRDRKAVALVAVPGLVAGLWMLWLRTVLPPEAEAVSEVTLPPFGGLVKATSTLWIHGHEWVGMASSLAALVLGVVVLLRRRGHPLWWMVATLMGFAAIMSRDVMGMNFGGTRSNMALLLFATLALFTPGAQAVRRLNSAPAQGDSGLVGPATPDGGSSNR